MLVTVGWDIVFAVTLLAAYARISNSSHVNVVSPRRQQH